MTISEVNPFTELTAAHGQKEGAPLSNGRRILSLSVLSGFAPFLRTPRSEVHCSAKSLHASIKFRPASDTTQNLSTTLLVKECGACSRTPILEARLRQF
mgnify:CR=1 FL=1